MRQEFTLNRGRAIINFTLKHCDNRQKILSKTGPRDAAEEFFSMINQ